MGAGAVGGASDQKAGRRCPRGGPLLKETRRSRRPQGDCKNNEQYIRAYQLRLTTVFFLFSKNTEIQQTTKYTTIAEPCGDPVPSPKRRPRMHCKRRARHLRRTGRDRSAASSLRGPSSSERCPKMPVGATHGHLKKRTVLETNIKLYYDIILMIII